MPFGIPMVERPKDYNALKREMLENKIKELQSNYYGPNMESEIGLRNSQTNEINKMLPERVRELTQKNKWYEPTMQSEISQRNALTNKYNTMTPLEAKELYIKNMYGKERESAEIQQKKAMSDYYLHGGGKGLGVAQNDMNAFSNQLKIDNPQVPGEDQNSYNRRINQIQSAHLAGHESLSNGTKLNPLSGTAEQLLLNVTGKNAPVAIKNQAANLDALVQDLGDYDIESVKQFAGPSGKLKLIDAKFKMATNPNDPSIDPMARRYLVSINQSIKNMDAMRKAYGTSVVPDYVYKTLGKLANPNSEIWNDSKQVEMNFDSVLKGMKKSRDLMFKKVKHGVTAGLDNKDNGKMYSDEDVKFTANEYGLSEEEVRKKLGIN